MGFLNAFLAGLGLAMDAFAVSVSKGLSQKKINIINMLVIAIFFGFFQFLMPVLGYYFCKSFAGYIESFDHWIAFILLSFLGAKMIFECLNENKEYKLKKQEVYSTNNKINEKDDIKENKNITTNQKVIYSCSNNIESGDVNNNRDDIAYVDMNLSSQQKNKLTLNIKELFFLAIATSIDALITGITFAFSGANIFLTAGIIGIITFILSCIGFLIGNIFGAKFKNIAEIMGGVVLILLGIKFLLEGYGVINLGF